MLRLRTPKPSRWLIAIGSTVGFIGLAAVVRLGLLDTLDSTMREWARPRDVWGPTQWRADYVVEGFRPAVLAGSLAVLTLVFCIVRRSIRPLALVVGASLLTVTLTLLAKLAVGRPDTHEVVDSHGGSFPSGHTISAVVCLGLAVVIAWPAPRRWLWLAPALAGGVMGAALMVQAAHWATDIVGGGLLAAAVLATVSAVGRNGWSQGSTTIDRRAAPRARDRPLPHPDPVGRLGPAANDRGTRN